MGLPGGLGGDEERDARQAVHTALAHLHEVQVAADDLVVDGVLGGVEQRHGAVLADLEGARPLLVQEVAPRGLGLADHVGAVGQAVGGHEGEAVGVGREREALPSRLDEVVAHQDSPLARVVDGELGALEGRPSQRAEPQRLAVLLGHVEAAADHLVRVVLALAGAVDLPVLADLEREGPLLVREVSRGGRGLAHLVGAVGQQVRGRRERAVVRVRGAAPHGLVLPVRLPAHRDGVGAAVVDGVGGVERGVALRGGGVELEVALGERHAAADHVVGNLRRHVGRDGLRGALRRDAHGVGLGVGEEVALGGLGLGHDDRAERNRRVALRVVVELVARDEVVPVEGGPAVRAGAQHPGARGLPLRLGGCVVLDAELRAGERRVALGGAARLGVHLRDGQSERVVLRGVRDVDAGRLASRHGGGRHGRGERVARGRLGLLDPVVARGDVLGGSRAVVARGDGRHQVGASLVGVHAVLGAREGVEAVAVGHLAVGARLGHAHLAVDREAP